MGSTSGDEGWANGRWRLRPLAVGLGALALACGSADPRLDPGGARGPANEPVQRLRSVSASDPASEGALRIGTSGDYTPFSRWSAPNAEPEGFSIAVARAYAHARGREVQWVRFRWPDLSGDLAAGRFDLALSGITIGPDRSLAGRFSLPLTRTGAVALVPAESDLRSGADLGRPGLRIAVNRGGHLERVARLLFGRAIIEAVPDNAAVPLRLAAGRAEERADAVLTDDLEAPHWQHQLPATRAIGPLTRDAKAAWFPIGSEPLVRDFDDWLQGFEASGALAELRARFGLAGHRTAEPIPALLASLDERLALMPQVARAKAALSLPVTDAGQEARVHESLRRAVERAAMARGSEPPSDTDRRRFVDALLRAARFIQEREQASPGPIAASGTDRDAARSALDDRIRPAIGFISERIARLVVAARCAPPDRSPGGDEAEPDDGSPSGRMPASCLPPSRRALSQALARHALPAALEAELHAALAQLLAPPNEAGVRPRPSARTAAHPSRAGSAPRDTAPSA